MNHCKRKLKQLFQLQGSAGSQWQDFKEKELHLNFKALLSSYIPQCASCGPVICLQYFNFLLESTTGRCLILPVLFFHNRVRHGRGNIEERTTRPYLSQRLRLKYQKEKVKNKEKCSMSYAPMKKNPTTMV